MAGREGESESSVSLSLTPACLQDGDTINNTFMCAHLNFTAGMFAPSYRLIVDMVDPFHSLSVIPAGQVSRRVVTACSSNRTLN